MYYCFFHYYSLARFVPKHKTQFSHFYFLVTLSKEETPTTAAAIAARTTPPATTDSKVFFREGVIAAMLLTASVAANAGADTAKVKVAVERTVLTFSPMMGTLLSSILAAQGT
jgi:hypothetical protein